MNRAPSLKALVAAFPSVDETNLKLIRRVWTEKERRTVKELCTALTPKAASWMRSCYSAPSTRAIRHRTIDELLGTHGLEYLGTHRRTGQPVYYCNSGDTYDTTLIFHGSNMYIGCWGDLVEGNKIKEAPM